MKIVIAAIADSHINGTVSLSLPSVNLDDGDTRQYSKCQRWLWQGWEDYWQRVERAAKKARLYVATVGDLGDLGVNGSTQVITKNDTDIKKHITEILEPRVRKADRFFVIRGTEAHVGQSAKIEEAIANDLNAEKCPDTNTYSWYHLRAEWGGKLFDVAHHASCSQLPWNKGSAASKLAARIIFQCAENGRAKPDFVLRGHRHTYEDSFQTFSTRAILLPCWTFKNAYAHKVATNELPDIGGAIITIDGKTVHVEIVRYPLDSEVDVIWREHKN